MKMKSTRAGLPVNSAGGDYRAKLGDYNTAPSRKKSAPDRPSSAAPFSA
jgi:hypothetical protein